MMVAWRYYFPLPPVHKERKYCLHASCDSNFVTQARTTGCVLLHRLRMHAAYKLRPMPVRSSLVEKSPVMSPFREDKRRLARTVSACLCVQGLTAYLQAAR